MFASKSVTEHLLRGALSLAVLWAAFHYSHAAPWGLFLAFPAAVVLWRGCPTCWLTGLFQTLANVAAGKEFSLSFNRCAVSTPQPVSVKILDGRSALRRNVGQPGNKR